MKCNAEETNYLGMLNYSACKVCQLKNSDKCPHLVVETEFTLNGKYTLGGK